MASWRQQSYPTAQLQFYLLISFIPLNCQPNDSTYDKAQQDVIQITIHVMVLDKFIKLFTHLFLVKLEILLDQLLSFQPEKIMKGKG